MITLNIELLKKIIKSQGKTLNRTAEELGISRSALFRKLRGSTQFTYPELIKLRDYLSLSKQSFYEIFFTKKVS